MTIRSISCTRTFLLHATFFVFVFQRGSDEKWRQERGNQKSGVTVCRRFFQVALHIFLHISSCLFISVYLAIMTRLNLICPLCGFLLIRDSGDILGGENWRSNQSGNTGVLFSALPGTK